MTGLLEMTVNPIDKPQSIGATGSSLKAIATFHLICIEYLLRKIEMEVDIN
jgi:hypothetical protein